MVGDIDQYTTVTENKVTASALISATGATSYAGGVVGYVAENGTITNNSFKSTLAAAKAVTGTKAAGCIAGNENSNYTDNNFSTTIAANATAFTSTGNVCDCGNNHAHPVSAISNNFMLGKVHTSPQLTSIAPAHNADATTANINGTVSIFEPIFMAFDKPMNKASVEAGFKVYRHGDNGAVTDKFYDKNDYNFTWSADYQTATATLKSDAAYEGGYVGGYYEHNRAYTVAITKATAKDIFDNAVSGTKSLTVNTEEGADIKWFFKEETVGLQSLVQLFQGVEEIFIALVVCLP